MNTYSVANELKHDISHATEKHVPYKQLVAWNCRCCSIALLTDYANNPIYQELRTEGEYFTNAGKKVYIDLRESKGYTGVLEKLKRSDS